MISPIVRVLFSRNFAYAKFRENLRVYSILQAGNMTSQISTGYESFIGSPPMMPTSRLNSVINRI